MTVCLLLTVLAALLAAIDGEGFRDRFLRALVVFGVVLVAITEGLSLIGAIRRGPLILCWSAVLLVGLVLSIRQRSRFRFTPASLSADAIVLLCSAGIAIILALSAVTAAFSPPNSADAMAYHMPRVVYWAQAGSVAAAYFEDTLQAPPALIHAFIPPVITCVLQFSCSSMWATRTLVVSRMQLQYK